MPLGQILAIAAGGASNGLNAVSDLYANKQNMAFSREMYEKQKNDSIAFWNMQNAYNDPSQQMARFSAAGLNPNLVYGNAGNNSAGNIPTPDVQPANIRAPKFDFDVLSPLLAQADLKIKAAQANNLNAQSEVIRQDAALRGYQAERAGFDLAFKREFRQLDADFLGESVRQKRIFSDVAINRDAREAISNSMSVSEAAERIATMIEQRPGFALQRGQTAAETKRIYENIKLMQQDGRLKAFEEKLNKSNMSKSDPLWTRIIADFLEGNSNILKPLEKLPSEMRYFPGPKY